MRKLFYFLGVLTCMGQGFTLRNPPILASRQGVVMAVAWTNNFLLLQTGDNLLLQTGDNMVLQ